MTLYKILKRDFPTMKSLDGVNKKNDVNNTASEAPEKNVKNESEKIDFSKVKVEPLFEEFVDFDTFSKSDFRAVKVKECVAVPKSKKLLQFTLDDGTGTDRTILSGIHAYYEPEELVGKTCTSAVRQAQSCINTFGLHIYNKYNKKWAVSDEIAHLCNRVTEKIGIFNSTLRRYLKFYVLCVSIIPFTIYNRGRMEEYL